MASQSRARAWMTLEEFLRWPRIDEKPYLEFVPSGIEAKVSPQSLHSLLEYRISEGLNRAAEPGGRGFAFPELRCTFAGVSIVPDVAFFLTENIKFDEQGQPVNEVFSPPDIHVEIRSPRQSLKKLREKLTHSINNGCPLGWLFDPERKTVDVFRPGQAPERLPADGILDASLVLPEFQRPVSEIFGGLILRPAPIDPGAPKS